MTRAEALTIAREHVEAMATNARGYQDGVTLSHKVGAVATFAQFLLGVGGDEEVTAISDRIERLEDRANDADERLTALEASEASHYA